jgi:pimeloyl-ACP methyl ester carboxylesterase
MTKHFTPAIATFTGAEGNKLVADMFGDKGAPVLLLHGGGQTRHAWRATAEAIARQGHVAYALDQRGHGDSDWPQSGGYSFPYFAKDVAIVAGELTKRGGEKPSVIGASLGGIASLIAEADAEKAGHSLFSSLVLVDITPRVDSDGVAKIHPCLHARACEGGLRQRR